jgi:hypothetical protein
MVGRRVVVEATLISGKYGELELAYQKVEISHFVLTENAR